MSFTLTQKEATLIKDLKGQEQLCADKYKKYAEQAYDPQLKQLFTDIASVEQAHYRMLTDMESGCLPETGNGSTVGSGQFNATYHATEMPEKKADAYLCTDLLTTEKHVSSLYNTSVFEFERPELRRVLSRIQADEQVHGERLYQYMKANSMYS